MGELGEQHVHVGIAASGGPREAAQDDAAQVGRHAAGGGEGLYAPAQDLMAEGLPGAPEEGAAAVEGLEEGDAEAELVGAGVGRAAEVLFGGHVRGGAAGVGVGGFGGDVELVVIRGADGLVGGDGEAEVDDAGPAFLVDEDVVGLEVAVDDALAMGGGEALPGGEEHVADLPPGARVLGEPGAEGLAADELHGDEEAAVDGADVEDAGDVGV